MKGWVFTYLVFYLFIYFVLEVLYEDVLAIPLRQFWLKLKATHPNCSPALSRDSAPGIPQLRAAPWLAAGEVTALWMLSEAISSPCSAGGFHTHKMDQLSNLQAPIHTTLTQLTQPDTRQED